MSSVFAVRVLRCNVVCYTIRLRFAHTYNNGGETSTSRENGCTMANVENKPYMILFYYSIPKSDAFLAHLIFTLDAHDTYNTIIYDIAQY